MPVWTKPRLVRFSVALLIGAVLAVAISAVTDNKSETSLLQGDFPAFYSAAVLVRTGETRKLYDPQRQRDIQNVYWKSLENNYLYFAYPPFFAALLSPLAVLDPLTAKAVFTLMMLLCLLVAVKISVDFSAEDKAPEIFLFILVLWFGPIFSGLLGGQLIPLLMLLYALSLKALKEDSDAGEFRCGFYLGLMAFKPHYAFILLLFYALAGKIRILLGALLPILFYYLLGAYIFGAFWPIDWLEHVSWFSEVDQRVNGHQMVSLYGATSAVSALLPAHPYKQIVPLVGIALALGIALTTAKHYLETLTLDHRAQTNKLFMLGMLAIPTTLLISPHSLYYDLGLLAIPWLYFTRFSSDREITKWLFLLLSVFLITMTKSHYPIQPLVVLLLWSFIVVRQLYASPRPYP